MKSALDRVRIEVSNTAEAHDKLSMFVPEFTLQLCADADDLDRTECLDLLLKAKRGNSKRVEKQRNVTYVRLSLLTILSCDEKSGTYRPRYL